jgi:TPR repeat protein
MSMRTKPAWTLLGAIIFAIAMGNTASAGSYEEAIAAYERQDYVAAMRLLLPLAEQGDANAQERLGHMYEGVWGVPHNFAEAMKWHRKAAEQGNADAHHSLGQMYEWGRGVPEDKEVLDTAITDCDRVVATRATALHPSR